MDPVSNEMGRGYRHGVAQGVSSLDGGVSAVGRPGRHLVRCRDLLRRDRVARRDFRHGLAGRRRTVRLQRTGATADHGRHERADHPDPRRSRRLRDARGHRLQPRQEPRRPARPAAQPAGGLRARVRAPWWRRTARVSRARAAPTCRKAATSNATAWRRRATCPPRSTTWPNSPTWTPTASWWPAPRTAGWSRWPTARSRPRA